MAAAQKQKKLKLSSGRIIKIYILVFLVFELIFYVSFQASDFWPLETSFYIYTPCLFLAAVFFCCMSLTKTYYLVDKNILLHYRMGKQVDYTWSHIIYIDHEYSIKHKMLTFYMEDGKQHMLAFDKEGLIYQYALQYGRLISKEEFCRRFPNQKL